MLTQALWQHRPSGVGEDLNALVQRRLEVVPAQHRPSGVGEDLNSAAMRSAMVWTLQHRPSGVGEDLNCRSLLEEARKSSAAPALRGR